MLFFIGKSDPDYLLCLFVTCMWGSESAIFVKSQDQKQYNKWYCQNLDLKHEDLIYIECFSSLEKAIEVLQKYYQLCEPLKVYVYIT